MLTDYKYLWRGCKYRQECSKRCDHTGNNIRRARNKSAICCEEGCPLKEVTYSINTKTSTEHRRYNKPKDLNSSNCNKYYKNGKSNKGSR